MPAAPQCRMLRSRRISVSGEQCHGRAGRWGAPSGAMNGRQTASGSSSIRQREQPCVQCDAGDNSKPKRESSQTQPRPGWGGCKRKEQQHFPESQLAGVQKRGLTRVPVARSLRKECARTQRLGVRIFQRQTRRITPGCAGSGQAAVARRHAYTWSRCPERASASAIATTKRVR